MMLSDKFHQRTKKACYAVTPAIQYSKGGGYVPPAILLTWVEPSTTLMSIRRPEALKKACHIHSDPHELVSTVTIDFPFFPYIAQARLLSSYFVAVCSNRCFQQALQYRALSNALRFF